MANLTARIVALIACAVGLLWLYVRAVDSVLLHPATTDDDHVDPHRQHDPLRFPPHDLADIRALLGRVQRRSSDAWWPVLLVYSCGYLLKQAFAIPGSAMMNVLAGALYGPVGGTVLVSVLTATGSTLCYGISWLVLGGAGGVLRGSGWLGGRVTAFRERLRRHRADLYWYLIFSRAFPFTPNWFLNMASPHVGIRVSWFYQTILIGLLPYNFITTSAGDVLADLSSISDIMVPSTVVKLVVIACVFLLMPVMKRRLLKRTAADLDKE